MGGYALWLVSAVVDVLTLYFLRGIFASKEPDVPTIEDDGDGAHFVERLQQQKKRIIIFFGSQTGTAEEYAVRIAREIKSRYGTSPMVVDPESEEMDKLDLLPEDCVAVFVMATYGEGDPTDNAVGMTEFLMSDDVAFQNGSTLENLHYVAFGLGNSTYEYFNEAIRRLDKRLQELGAHRIGERGEGDDEKGLEDDYMLWKDPMFEELAAYLGLEEGATGDLSDFAVTELDEAPSKLYEGEYHPRGLNGMLGNHDARTLTLRPWCTHVSCSTRGRHRGRVCIWNSISRARVLHTSTAITWAYGLATLRYKWSASCRCWVSGRSEARRSPSSRLTHSWPRCPSRCRRPMKPLRATT